MKKLLSSAILLATTFGLVGGMLVPATVSAAAKKTPTKSTKSTKAKPSYKISISAIPGADEKNFDEAVTRCLTKEMKGLHAKTVERMKADIEKKGSDHAAAVATYKDKIDIVWSAMEQPYCGYGSRGMAAVKHSYLKSVQRIRAEFLAATK